MTGIGRRGVSWCVGGLLACSSLAVAQPVARPPAQNSDATRQAVEGTAGKGSAAKAAAAKSTAAKSTAAKSTAAKSTAAKSTAAKATGLESAAPLAEDAVAALADSPDETALNPSEHAFNGGELFRLSTAELMAVLREPRAGIWRYESGDWAHPERGGALVRPSQLEDAVRGGRLSSLVDGFRFEWNGDSAKEVLLVPRVRPGSDAAQFAPTLLVRDGAGRWTLGVRPVLLPGEVYVLEDIRDQNGDGRVEIVFSAQIGNNSFYTYYAVWASQEDGDVVRYVTRAPDSLHLVSLGRPADAAESDPSRFQFLVRHLISQRGPVRLWNWVDEVVEWDGQRFVAEPEKWISYHDQVTKHRLVDELIDCYDADSFIVQTKIDVMRQVHALVLGKRPIQVPRTDVRQRVARLRALDKRDRARALLASELRRDPYQIDAVALLAEMLMEDGEFGRALDMWYRVLGMDPDNGVAWHNAGICFGRLQERSSAVSCFVNSVRLVDEKEARRQRLVRAAAREGEDELVAAAMAQALVVLEGAGAGGAPAGGEGGEVERDP